MITLILTALAIAYLGIGAAFTIILNGFAVRLTQEGLCPTDRVVSVLFWPIGLIILLFLLGWSKR